ncbi:MAG: hypothetical protein AAF626_18535 [Pseudomonadota bacterium]
MKISWRVPAILSLLFAVVAIFALAGMQDCARAVGLMGIPAAHYECTYGVNRAIYRFTLAVTGPLAISFGALAIWKKMQK